MTSRDFCYWLQGYFEITGKNQQLTQDQSEMVQKHLSIVFKHEIDPSFGDSETELNSIHNQEPMFTEQSDSDLKVRC